MMPCGPLMIEHRLIEKLMPLIRTATEAARRDGRIDPAFVGFVVDFVRTYADRCHHGKEEDILFRELDRKPLAPAHRVVMDELVEEHRTGRIAVGELRAAAEAYGRGDRDALPAVVERLERLAGFYPAHIAKEDKGFFLPVMEYFSPEESEALLAEEREFDRGLIHELYGGRLAEATARLAAGTKTRAPLPGLFVGRVGEGREGGEGREAGEGVEARTP